MLIYRHHLSASFVYIFQFESSVRVIKNANNFCCFILFIVQNK